MEIWQVVILCIVCFLIGAYIVGGYYKTYSEKLKASLNEKNCRIDFNFNDQLKRANWNAMESNKWRSRAEDQDKEIKWLRDICNACYDKITERDKEIKTLRAELVKNSGPIKLSDIIEKDALDFFKSHEHRHACAREVIKQWRGTSEEAEKGVDYLRDKIVDLVGEFKNLKAIIKNSNIVGNYESRSTPKK